MSVIEFTANMASAFAVSTANADAMSAVNFIPDIPDKVHYPCGLCLQLCSKQACVLGGQMYNMQTVYEKSCDVRPRLDADTCRG